MGIHEDLGLQGNDFSNIATFLFVGLLAFEIPNSKTRITHPDDPHDLRDFIMSRHTSR